jgi:hypothetical protein
MVRNAKIAQPKSDQLEVSIGTPAGTYRWSFQKESGGFVLRR